MSLVTFIGVLAFPIMGLLLAVALLMSTVGVFYSWMHRGD